MESRTHLSRDSDTATVGRWKLRHMASRAAAFYSDRLDFTFSSNRLGDALSKSTGRGKLRNLGDDSDPMASRSPQAVLCMVQWGRVLTVESHSPPAMLLGPGPKPSCQCGKVQAPQHAPTLHAFQVRHPSLVPRPVLAWLLSSLQPSSVSTRTPLQSPLVGWSVSLAPQFIRLRTTRSETLQVLSMPGKGEGPLESLSVCLNLDLSLNSGCP